MRAHFWPGFVLFIAALSLAGTGALIYWALSDPSFAVEPDYYAQGLDWDRTARQRVINEQLGWRIEVQPDTPGMLIVRVIDRDDRPINEASVECELFPNIHAADRRTLILQHGSSGCYSTPFEPSAQGSWRLRFVVRGVGPSMFTAEFDHTFSRPPLTRAELRPGAAE